MCTQVAAESRKGGEPSGRSQVRLTTPVTSQSAHGALGGGAEASGTMVVIGSTLSASSTVGMPIVDRNSNVPCVLGATAGPAPALQSARNGPDGQTLESREGATVPAPPPGAATAVQPGSGRSASSGGGDRGGRGAYAVPSGQAAAEYAASLLGWMDVRGPPGSVRGGGGTLRAAPAGPRCGMDAGGFLGPRAAAAVPRAAARAPATAASRQRMRERLEDDFTCPVTQVCVFCEHTPIFRQTLKLCHRICLQANPVANTWELEILDCPCVSVSNVQAH